MKKKITIVYDNCLNKPGLKTGWGFSALIETEDAPPLLFDTGDDGAALLYNMAQLGIDPERIGTIVISHNHSDHTGGLREILRANQQSTVYLPASAAGSIPGREVFPVRQFQYILNEIFSTGELGGIEQSLGVETDRGILVVTGCSHPGVETILDAVSQHGKIRGIIGGLHGFSNLSQLEGLSFICPCHCTRYKEELERRFPNSYLGCGAGLELAL